MKQREATAEGRGVRLHLGCGRDVKEGWINLDQRAGPGVDVVADLDACARTPLPFEDDSVDEILGSHLFEHLADPLAVMQELYRIARPGCTATFSLPYGSSDDAFTDPTHVRPYFIGSFGYFSQPYYWRADYGYRGDWQPGYILLRIDRPELEGLPPEEILSAVTSFRNIVREMTVVLAAVKPARPQERALQQQPDLEFQFESQHASVA